MLHADQTVLVVVDIQGKLATLMHERETFFANVVRMIEAVKVLSIPILWNEQLPDKLGPTIDVIKDAIGDETPLVKNCFSCSGNNQFVQALQKQNRKQVLLVGMETHICVYQTAVDLLGDGYEVHVVADGVASRIPENKVVGIDVMKSLGAKLTSVEMALFEMLGKAEGDAFKQIIRIVK